MATKISIIGTGYVGLALAVELGKKFRTIAFDISASRIAELRNRTDSTGEFGSEELAESTFLEFSCNESDIKGSEYFIVTVGTPIYDNGRPDLRALVAASGLVGRSIVQGGTVVFESTVYPGATEEVCIPAIARASGLVAGVDFSVGYSPERINPGDKVRRLPDIVKVVSGDTPASAQRIASLYSQVISAGVHVATSIKVAEAAKVIENTQRDLLIALTNELAIIFERLGIDTREVLEAASTKWNFVKLKPGLVGGHCISVDPYYLLYKSETAGYVPSLIHAGRRINEHMPIFIANRLARLVPRGRVLVVGFAFKDNCSDIRNSKVFDLYCELLQRGYSVDVVDARVDPQMVIAEYGVSLSANVGIEEYDGVVYCVNHEEHQNLMMSWRDVLESKATVVFDVSGNLKPVFLGTGVRYVTW